MNVLSLCTTTGCRSQMAQAVLEHRAPNLTVRWPTPPVRAFSVRSLISGLIAF